MNSEIDNEKVTISQIKAIALLMTHVAKEHNNHKEWVKGVEDLTQRIIEYVEACK